MNRTQAIQNQPFDADEWQKLYYRHQQQYIRHRLFGSQTATSREQSNSSVWAGWL